jgi:carboxylesterase type B
MTAPVVETTLGSVQGRASDGVLVFKGIPYAREYGTVQPREDPSPVPVPHTCARTVKPWIDAW